MKLRRDRTDLFRYPVETPNGTLWASSKTLAREARKRVEQGKAPNAELHPEPQRAFERVDRHQKRTPGRLSWRHIQRAYYRQHGRCYYCRVRFPGGDLPSTAHFHIEHVKPVVAGGRNDGGNVVLACRACNLEKSACPAHLYVASRRRRGLPTLPRSAQFSMWSAPERLAEQREARKGAAVAPSKPQGFLRRRPERGKAATEQSRLDAPTAQSARAKAMGEVRAG